MEHDHGVYPAGNRDNDAVVSFQQMVAVNRLSDLPVEQAFFLFSFHIGGSHPNLNSDFPHP